MPKIISEGPLVPLEKRWPHTEEFICPKCKTRFSLTPQDSIDGYYTLGGREIERGPQWDTWMDFVPAITFRCPRCTYIFERTAPSDWTIEFATGGARKK